MGGNHRFCFAVPVEQSELVCTDLPRLQHASASYRAAICHTLASRKGFIKKKKKDKISFYLAFGSAVPEGIAEGELCRRCLCSTGSSVWKGKVPVEG